MGMMRAGLLGLILIAAVTGAAAQTGALQVTVTDEAGPLPGATVKVSNDRGYVAETAIMTNPKGVAVFPVLRAGDGYSIEVSFPGLGTIRKDGIHISSGQTYNEAVQLAAQLTEQVKVVAERDVIDLDQQEQSMKFSDEFIQDLPIPGRSYQNVLTLAPGVNDDNNDGQPTVHGSRARDFKPIVSGVAAVDPLTGRIMGDVNPDSIEEMEVVTAGAGVEFGRAQGGYARIIQKQGSNQFEGSFQILFRTSKLDAGSSRGSLSDPDYNSYQPAFLLSGPIVKDKLWYRLSHQFTNFENAVDTGSGAQVATYRQVIHSDQITWQVSPRNKLAFLYDSDPWEVDNWGISSVVPPESSRSQSYGGDKFTVRWTAPYSPKILVETTVAYQDYFLDILPTDINAANDCISDQSKPALVSGYCQSLVDGSVSGPFPTDWQDSRQRFTLASQATLYGGRFWGMNHQFKVGFSVENERYFRTVTRRPTIFRRFQRDDDGGGGGFGDPNDPQPQPDPRRSEGFLVRLAADPTDQASSTGTIWGVYAEDQIKPTNNLSITLGVRIDNETLRADGYRPFDPAAELASYESALQDANDFASQQNLTYSTYTGLLDMESFITGIASQIEPSTANQGTTALPCAYCGFNTLMSYTQRPDPITIDNTNVSPRINVAWLPWSNGKTKLQAAWGRNYNNLFLAVPLVERQPLTADIEIVCNTNLSTDEQTCAGGQGNNVVPNASLIDRDLSTPYQDELLLAVERELWAETSVRFSYINRKYRDQLQDIDINHAPADYGVCIPSSQRVAGGPTVTGEPDGVLDDCVGSLVPGGAAAGFGDSFVQTAKDVPDGIPDLYMQNPIWGDLYLIGNFNEADYEAFVLDLRRRQYRGWEMNGSYVYSEATGNGEDWQQLAGDDQSLVRDEFGYQSNDVRHFIKLAATTITPWGFRFGTTVQWQSGLPYSIRIRELSRDAVPPSQVKGTPNARPRIRYATGQRNDQRNVSWWDIGVKFTKEIQLPKGMNLQLSADIFNLLDDRTYIIYNPGTEIGQQINGRNEAYVRAGRRFQIIGKVTF
jgi:hypothetical protein